jgi:hypothetical protein
VEFLDGDFCSVAECEPCLPCFQGEVSCTFGQDTIESSLTTLAGIDVQLFPAISTRCGANAEGYFCVPVNDIGDSMSGCLEHCKTMLGDDLASASIERLFLGECCWYTN